MADNLARKSDHLSKDARMSNIANIFNPPPSRDLSENEAADCVPCQVMATLTGILAGTYFATGRVFAGEKPGLNPKWWKTTVRSGGAAMILFGIYRGGQGWAWNLDHQYK